MKSKPIIYLLAFSVLGIWGVILFRVYLSVSDKEEVLVSGAGTLPLRKADIPKLYPDSFKLLMNYRDPFTGAAAIEKDTSNSKTRSLPLTSLPVQPEINPALQMKYLGYVRDRKEKNSVAIISYKGREKMMKKGDTIGGVTLTDIQKQGIMMWFNGKMITIKAE